MDYIAIYEEGFFKPNFGKDFLMKNEVDGVKKLNEILCSGVGLKGASTFLQTSVSLRSISGS